MISKYTTANVLGRVRKYFPEVNRVVDAKKTISINVTPHDCRQGRRKKPDSCALARACMRHGADGAIINIGTSYVIKGRLAIRYRTSVGVGREITSFDRHHDFAPGRDYKLCAMSASNALGKDANRPRLRGKHTGKKKPLAVHGLHRTARIRVAQQD